MNSSLRFFIKEASKGVDLQPVISELKNNHNYKDWCAITDDVTPLVTRNLSWLIGNPLPQSYAALGVTPPAIAVGDFEKEVEWLFLTLRKYYTELNRFLLLKAAFENAVIVNDLENAELLLIRMGNNNHFLFVIN